MRRTVTARVRTLVAVAAAVLAGAPSASADSLGLPSVLDRSGPVTALWRIDPPIAADANLSVRWTDTEGRLVERHDIPIPAGTAAVPITIDLRRALTRRNTLTGALVLPDASRSAEAVFIAPPARAQGASGWSDFHVIMWQEGTPARARGLRRIGFTAGMVIADRDGTGVAETARRMDTMWQADLAWYVENIATDFYAAYHRWQPGKPVTWLYDETRRRQAADPTDPAGYMRTPSLSDTTWIARIQQRLGEHVRAHGPNRPLYYSLGDEVGIADLAAFWDFDLSPESLSGFRDWLRTEYGSLAALSQEWGTEHATWAQVMPMLTSSAIRRSDDNFASWSDFKDWMDLSFARALRAGTEAVHAADPTALSGIEGVQNPGWGGFDYTRLAHAVDLMESSNGGHSMEIARSLNPALLVVSAAFGSGPAQQREIWRQVLVGSRGVVIWDGESDVVTPEGEPGPRGRALAPTIAELRNGLAAQIIAAAAPTEPVAILVSRPSFRVHWLLDRRADGMAWEQRDSETEWGSSTADGRALSVAMKHLTALGIRPRFLSPAMLASGSGSLASAGVRVLILPQTIALSDAEAAAVQAFVAAGGTVFADGPVGLFDGHGKRRASPVLDGVAIHRPASLATQPAAVTGQSAGTGSAPSPGRSGAGALAEFAAMLRMAGVVPAADWVGADGRPRAGIEARRWQTGGVTLWSVLPAEGQGPGVVTIVLPAPAWIGDPRGGRPPVHTDRFSVTVPEDGPALLTVSATRPSRPRVVGPESAEAGALVPFRMGLSRADGDGATHVLHVEVIDPRGQVRDRLTENIPVTGGDAVWLLRLALDDPAGKWIVRATDRLGGGSVDTAITVRAAVSR